MPRPLVRRCAIVCLLLVTAAATAWSCLWVTDRVIWKHEPIGGFELVPARLTLLAVTTAALLGAFAAALGLTRRSRWLRRGLALVLPFAVTLPLFEAVFTFVPQSHNVGYILAARTWYLHHWGRENSLGYRDVEPQRVAGKRLVFAVGDSFTAGAGIADVAARYTEVLAAARPDLQVMNLGVSGADSVAEFAHLQQHPLRPDVVVLQYYPNDVDGAAQRAGHLMPPFTAYEDLPSVKLRFLVRNSFLANFVYWQFPHGDGHGYEQFLEHMQTDAEVQRLHHGDLEKFCTWCDEHRVPLVVALFPVLEDLAESARLTAHVKQFFRERKVQVLDVADLIGDLPVSQRTVNHHDGHASALVHERVGKALAQLLHT